MAKVTRLKSHLSSAQCIPELKGVLLGINEGCPSRIHCRMVQIRTAWARHERQREFGPPSYQREYELAIGVKFH